MKNSLTNLGLLLASLVILFLTLEFGLRFYRAAQAAAKESREFRGISSGSGQAGAFRIFYFGESTMESSTLKKVTIPRLVEITLRGEAGGRPIHSKNFGKAGSDTREILRRAKDLLSSHPSEWPDLAVIQAGHNLFLSYEDSFLGFLIKYENPVLNFFFKHSLFFYWIFNRSFRLENLRPKIQDRSLVDEPVLSEANYQKVLAQYQADIREAVSMFNRTSIPVILMTHSSNLRDWEPNRSYCPSSLSKDEKEKAEKKFLRARSEEREGRFDTALKEWNSLLEDCPEFSEAHYRLGVLNEKKGNPARAAEFYQKAVDWDGMPVRAVRAENEFLRGLCSASPSDLVFCADIETAFHKHSPQGLVGNNLIYDNVHPNLNGYALMANEVSTTIHSIFGGPEPVLFKNGAEVAKTAELTNEDYFEASITMGRYLTRLATWRYDMESRLRRADLFFERARKIRPGRFESYLGLAMTSFLRREISSAEDYLRQAKQISEKDVRSYLGMEWGRQIVLRAYSPKA